MKVLAIVLALMLVGVTAPQAQVIELPLERMIERSSLIVVGRVIRVEQVPTPKSVAGSRFGEAEATIEIEQILVGNYGDKQIAITYYPRLSTESGFEVGERAVVFIGGRQRTVQGYAGKIPIEKENVKVQHILGEAESQTLEGFIQRIKDCASRQQKK